MSRRVRWVSGRLGGSRNVPTLGTLKKTPLLLMPNHLSHSGRNSAKFFAEFAECFAYSYYNQGQKSLDRLSLFSFIHPFTVLTLIFCLFLSGIVTLNPCIQMQFPLPTPCFNVALNSGVRASTIWINIENGERGKSLLLTPQWSNTFGPDCLSKL